MSSDVVALLDGFPDVKLITPTQAINVITNAPTLEDAIAALLQASSTSSIKSVFVRTRPLLKDREKAVKALQKAGYKNIETIDLATIETSFRVSNLPLKCAIGDLIFDVTGSKRELSWYKCHVNVLRKCKNGWQFVGQPMSPYAAVKQYPKALNFIINESVKEEDRDAVVFLFGDRKLHEAPLMDSNYKITYIRNRINNVNDVLPYCHFDFVIEFGHQSERIVSAGRVPPFTITKEVDVGQVPMVKIHAVSEDDEMLVKGFTFKTDASRTVSITVHVDKTLLPQVTLKTVATHSLPNQTPLDCTPSIIFSITYICETFMIIKLSRTEAAKIIQFHTIDKAVAFMKKETRNAVAVLFLQYREDAKISELRTFRDEFAKAGFTDVRFLSYESVTVSHFLKSLQIPIGNGQSVAVLSPKYFYIITRDGRKLKLRTRGPMNEFEVKRCNVKSVVIAHEPGRFEKALLDKLRKKFGSNFHVVADVQNVSDFTREFLWSFVDESVSNTYALEDYCNFDVEIKGHTSIPTRFREIPLSMRADVTVTGTVLEVNLAKSEDTVELLKKFTLEHGTKRVRITVDIASPCDITVTMAELDDHTSEPSDVPAISTELSQLELNPLPTTILTFTSDNRVLIEADTTYTGDNEILAYVWIQSGKPAQIGKDAFDALQTHPDSVFYDITRLLAIDFDPDHPDPSWCFRTSRDADGTVLIHGADDIVTLPTALFGLVVKSTLMYIKERNQSQVTEVGVRLPSGSVISATDLKGVSDKIGTKLVIVETKL